MHGTGVCTGVVVCTKSGVRTEADQYGDERA